MKLHTKSFVYISISTLLMTILLTFVSLSAYQSFSLSSVSTQSRMAAEIVKIGLTEEMLQGVIDHRASLLARLKHVPGIENVRIVRGPAVIKQHGPGIGTESTYTETERTVLQTGKPVEHLQEGDKIVYQATIPYIASMTGSVNCLQCHEVSEGTVLGAVSMDIDITAQRSEAYRSAVTIIVLLIIFAIILTFLLRRLLSPVIHATEQLHGVVADAEVGVFSHRLNKISNDEIGQIVDDTNQLMQSLEENIGSMSEEIESLTEFTTLSNDKNQMKRTLGAVRNMVDAARFKQAIENDRNLEEVYNRVQRVLFEKFNLKRFSLYEMDQIKKRLRCIFAQGLPESAELWCEAEVLIHSDACRACRTAHLVQSKDDPHHCPSFAGNGIQQDEDLMYACLPVMLSGTVGGVLQVVFNADEKDYVYSILPAIRIYLGEASPVIETKLLMRSLKESAMRDAMTGLYNRRFLEEYLDVLSATVERKNINVGILMCDVDYFKKVNDSLGHEAGDAVLIDVAKTLKQAVRTSDMVIRYGGEEFLALLIDTEEEKAMEVAERIRSTIEAHAFVTSGGKLNKTISVGVSMFPKDGGAFWQCAKYADVAMYQAKDTGRNQVIRFESDMWKDDEEY